MNEKRIELPTGGFAWLATIADHGQAKATRRLQMRLARFTDSEGKWRAMTPEEEDARDELITETSALSVRTFCLRWENVRAPNGDALSFPDDVDRMAEPDIEFLFNSIETALAEGRADPNAKRPSGSSPRRASSRKTRSSATTSSTS